MPNFVTCRCMYEQQRISFEVDTVTFYIIDYIILSVQMYIKKTEISFGEQFYPDSQPVCIYCNYYYSTYSTTLPIYSTLLQNYCLVTECCPIILYFIQYTFRIKCCLFDSYSEAIFGSTWTSCFLEAPLLMSEGNLYYRSVFEPRTPIINILEEPRSTFEENICPIQTILGT